MDLLKGERRDEERGKGGRLIGMDGYEWMVFFCHMMNGSMGGWDC